MKNSVKNNGVNKKQNSQPSSGTHTFFNEGEWGLHWHYRIPLVGNGILWRELIFTLGAPFVIVAGLVTIFSQTDNRWSILIIFIVLFGVILLIAFLILSSLSRSLGGSIDASFSLNPAGIGYEAGEAARKIHRSALMLSLISGLVSAMGTSLIALSQEKNFISWADVKNVRFHPYLHIIYIWGIENGRPIALYCTPEIFEQVGETIRNNIPETGKKI
jgi:hypothetical protein